MPFAKLKYLSTQLGEDFDNELNTLQELSKASKKSSEINDDISSEINDDITAILEVKKNMNICNPFLVHKSTTGAFSIFSYYLFPKIHIMQINKLLRACLALSTGKMKDCAKQLLAEQSLPCTIQQDGKTYTIKINEYYSPEYNDEYDKYTIPELEPLKDEARKIGKKFKKFYYRLPFFKKARTALSLKYIKLTHQYENKEKELINIFIDQQEEQATKLFNEKNLDQFKQLIPEIVDCIQRIIKEYDRFENESGIPASLRDNLSAIKTLKSYFDNMRVDTMKEAINLYYQEVREEQFYESVNQAIEQAQKKAQQEAKERERILTSILDAQKEWNTSMKKRNDSLNEIKDSLKDISKKLES